MARTPTRREFLKVSALSLAATAANPRRTDALSRVSPGSTGDVRLFITAGNQRHVECPSIRWAPARRPSHGDSITVDPGRMYQEILGFGAAFTEAACSVLMTLPEGDRASLLRELFDPNETGLSVCRTCIGSSDYSTKLFSYDDGEADPELLRFSIGGDEEAVLPVLRLARKVNPDLFLFSSPWSPPGWMKTSNSLLGGSMRKRDLPLYARYMVKFLEAYAAEGVQVQAVTPQNEVDTDQDGRMPACLWAQEHEIEFVRDHLGPLLERKGIPTKIWILDHNYNLWGRAVCELEDANLRRYVGGVAWHGYAGTPEMMRKVQDLYPTIPMYWTEGGPDVTDPGYLTDWAKWGETFAGVLQNGCSAITAWNLALDEQGRPNLGPFPCGGVVSVHSKTKGISRSGQYWALAHYSRAIPRGARRIESSGVSGLGHVAAKRPDGGTALVLSNPGSARVAEVRLGDRSVEVALPEASVATLAWSA